MEEEQLQPRLPLEPPPIAILAEAARDDGSGRRPRDEVVQLGTICMHLLKGNDSRPRAKTMQ
eukprot:6997806-Pyramimonas_sp.AAC.1